MAHLKRLEDVMAQPGEQDGAAPVKRVRARNRIVVNGGGLKKIGGDKTGGDVTVSVSKSRFKLIADKQRLIGKLLADYADTLAQAEREGRVATVTLRVSPDGEAQFVTASPAGGDALDAALSAARVRGQAKVNDILKGRDMLSARDFGSLIGASHETVNVKRRKGEVLGLEGATRGFKYPRWQVTDVGLPLPGLAALFEVLGEQPWTVYRFLRTPHAELGGRTALDALKSGRVDAVLGAARNQTAGAFA